MEYRIICKELYIYYCMKKTFKLTESKLITLIKDIINEQEMDEVTITPEQYYDLMRKVF